MKICWLQTSYANQIRASVTINDTETIYLKLDVERKQSTRIRLNKTEYDQYSSRISNQQSPLRNWKKIIKRRQNDKGYSGDAVQLHRWCTVRQSRREQCACTPPLGPALCENTILTPGPVPPFPHDVWPCPVQNRHKFLSIKCKSV